MMGDQIRLPTADAPVTRRASSGTLCPLLRAYRGVRSGAAVGIRAPDRIRVGSLTSTARKAIRYCGGRLCCLACRNGAERTGHRERVETDAALDLPPCHWTRDRKSRPSTRRERTDRSVAAPVPEIVDEDPALSCSGRQMKCCNSRSCWDQPQPADGTSPRWAATSADALVSGRPSANAFPSRRSRPALQTLSFQHVTKRKRCFDHLVHSTPLPQGSRSRTMRSARSTSSTVAFQG